MSSPNIFSWRNNNNFGLKNAFSGAKRGNIAPDKWGIEMYFCTQWALMVLQF